MTQNYLALDIGSLRIGLAVGSMMPFGRGTLDAKDPEEALKRIKDIVEHEHITKIIVGVPKVPSGDATESHKLALSWVERIKKVVAIPVVTVDEAYSSVAAEEQLKSEGVDIDAHKEKIDERAAEIILDQFLLEQDVVA